MILVDMSYS